MTEDNLLRLSETTTGLKLPGKDAALFIEMLQAYMSRRLGSLRHKPQSVNRDVAVIRDFLNFSGKAPWYWTEGDFERWGYQIGINQGLAVSSQRKYQGAIRNFLKYLVENVKFRNDVRREYGVDLVQICHDENCIPHLIDREISRERPALTHDEISQLFSAYDSAIAEAAKFASKDLRPLQRDKAMFYTTYIGGLRASEVLGLNITSFQPNPDISQFGRAGFISVWGKGSKGSGPKHRLVPVTHPMFPPLLDWYISEIRPYFLENGHPNETALFLSERGRRLSISSFEARFQHGMSLAALEGRGFTPHCLRHSSVTHESLRFSMEAVRRKHGHVYEATTQVYMHVDDAFVHQEMTKIISSQLDTSLRKDDK